MASTRRLDFSTTGYARVVAITIVGSIASMVLAPFVIWVTIGLAQLLPPNWGGIAMQIAPIIMTAPICYYFALKHRELALAYGELAARSSRDDLTGCYNREAFLALADAELNLPEPDSCGALLVIDIDHFKKVNDEFGHASGDRALRLVSAAVGEVLRDGDLLGRIGGEEFAVLLPRADRPNAERIAERVRSSVSSTAFQCDDRAVQLSVSIGAAAYDGVVMFADLFSVADAHLYDAKRGGRDRVQFESPRIEQAVA